MTYPQITSSRPAQGGAVLLALLSGMPGCVETWDLGGVVDAGRDGALSADAGDAGLDARACAEDHGTCSVHSDCCSGLCEAILGEQGLCRPVDLCLPLGASCGFSSACCSFRCEDGACSDRAGPCLGSGAICLEEAECCSGLCDDSTSKCRHLSACRPAGDDCGSNGDCCGGLCQPLPGADKKRCARLPTCRVTGELCDGAASCCSGVCASGADGLDRCAQAATPALCLSVGEVCSLMDQCCSGVCAVADGTVSRCQPLGGCRPVGERCLDHSDCCSEDCGAGLDGVQRCLSTPGCGLLGDRCSMDEGCCGGVPGSCREGAQDPWRCLGDPMIPCLAAEELCATDDGCCSSSCRLLADEGQQACVDSSGCVPPGERCTGLGQCCPGAACLPVGAALRCLVP